MFVHALGAGVLYLRVLPSTLQTVHAELERMLGLCGEAELQGAFVVVEPGRHRVRRPVTDGAEADAEAEPPGDGSAS